MRTILEELTQQCVYWQILQHGVCECICVGACKHTYVSTACILLYVLYQSTCLCMYVCTYVCVLVCYHVIFYPPKRSMEGGGGVRGI